MLNENRFLGTFRGHNTGTTGLSRNDFGRFQNHFFTAKISQIVQVGLGMVLDASKTIFFHC